MSNYPNSHLYCNNNIYKIVLSMDDNLENQNSDYNDEHNKLVEIKLFIF